MKQEIMTTYNPNVSIGKVEMTYIQFGEKIRIHLATGEVTGLSENISEDARLFWDYVKEYI